MLVETCKNTDQIKKICLKVLKFQAIENSSRTSSLDV